MDKWRSAYSDALWWTKLRIGGLWLWERSGDEGFCPLCMNSDEEFHPLDSIEHFLLKCDWTASISWPILQNFPASLEDEEGICYWLLSEDRSHMERNLIGSLIREKWALRKWHLETRRKQFLNN